MVVASDNVSEGGESFFYALDYHRVWEGVAKVLEFEVSGSGGEEDSAAVSDCGSAYEAASSYCGVDYWDVV